MIANTQSIGDLKSLFLAAQSPSYRLRFTPARFVPPRPAAAALRREASGGGNGEAGPLAANRREFLLVPSLAMAVGFLYSVASPAVAAAEEKAPEPLPSDSLPSVVDSEKEEEKKEAEPDILSRVYDATVIGEPEAVGKDKKRVWEKLMGARVVYLGESEMVPDRDDRVLELEILKNLRSRCLEQERTISLALEAFPIDLQEQINQFMDGRIDGGILRTYTSHWPLERWQEYEPLLNYCRDNGVKLVACGTPLKVLEPFKLKEFEAFPKKNASYILLQLARASFLDSLPFLEGPSERVGSWNSVTRDTSELFDLEQYPLMSELIHQFQGFRERLLADPKFLHRLAIEEAISITTTLLAQYEKRKGRFLEEIDYVLTDTIRGSVVDFFTVWLPAPTLSFLSYVDESSSSENFELLKGLLGSIPDNAFQKNVVGKDWDLNHRLASVFVGGLKLAGVGFISSIGAGVASDVLYSIRRTLRPAFSVNRRRKRTPILKSAIVYGGFLGTSANLRYQIIAGIVEHRLSDYLISYSNGTLLVNALSFTVRTINSYWGTQQWIDLARFTGLQPQKKETKPDLVANTPDVSLLECSTTTNVTNMDENNNQSGDTPT